MIGRSLARFLMTIALLCASLAWTGWVVLHTVADPTRSHRIAHAVLDDPTARGQIADDLASSLADAVNTAAAAAAKGTPVKVPKIDGNDPTLRSAVASALADTRVTNNLVDALANEHANLLGVEPKKPAAIDTTLLIDTVSRGVSVANPGLAAQLTSATPKSIALPDVEIPLAARIRRFVTTAVPRLAIVAILLAAVAFMTGDRARMLRRAGTWAIGAGLMWVLLPRIAIWAAEQWAPGNAAVVRALLRGATGVVTAMATLLLLGGIAAAVAGFLLQRLASINGEARAPFDPKRRDQTTSPSAPMTAGWRPFTGRDLPRHEAASTPARVDHRM